MLIFWRRAEYESELRRAYAEGVASREAVVSAKDDEIAHLRGLVESLTDHQRRIERVVTGLSEKPLAAAPVQRQTMSPELREWIEAWDSEAVRTSLWERAQHRLAAGETSEIILADFEAQQGGG